MLNTLRDGHPALAEAITLAHDFVTLLRTRQPHLLDGWLREAAASSLPAFRRLAKSFRRDYVAVKAGVTFAWSMGPVEGHINRLKMLKRQMFGRAALDLLELRLLHAG